MMHVIMNSWPLETEADHGTILQINLSQPFHVCNLKKVWFLIKRLVN